MVTIEYNGINPFSGLAPTPFVAKRQQPIHVGERWGVLDIYTLAGELTGFTCGNGFYDIVDKQNQLLGNFASDFKGFRILEDGQEIESAQYVKINNINFDTAKYFGLIPFQIELQSYPSGFFNGDFGIIDPSHEISFEEDDNGIINISQTISARGFVTDSDNTNALENAKRFVQQRTGFNYSIFPAFIKYCNFSPCLKTSQESINRLNATYSIVETYRADAKTSGDFILRYTMEFNSGIDPAVSTVSMNGTVDGCKNTLIENLRSSYNSINKFSKCVDYYKNLTNATDLNPYATTSGITEDGIAKKISFNLAFDNDPSPLTTFEYKTSFQQDHLTDIVSCSLDGRIKSRGNLKNKWERVSAYYSGLSVYPLALKDYFEYASGTPLINSPLNSTPKSSGVAFDKYNAEIGISVSWDNSPVPPSGLDVFQYTLDFTPAIRKYNASPCLDGEGAYYVVDLDYLNREMLSIQGNSIISKSISKEEGINIINGHINFLSNKYITGRRKVLEEESFSRSNQGFDRMVNFNATWSAEGVEFTL